MSIFTYGVALRYESMVDTMLSRDRIKCVSITNTACGLATAKLDVATIPIQLGMIRKLDGEIVAMFVIFR